MKLLVCFFVLTFTIASPAQTVDQIENRRLEAVQKGDYEFVELLLAPQFVMTRPDGSVLDRSEYIQRLKSGQLKVQNVHHSDVQIHILGNTAVITGLSVADLHDSNGDRNVTARYTHTYVKGHDGWLLLAMHTSEFGRR